MGLETSTYVDGLNIANPAATDGLAQADDHIRLIKTVLKNTFPNLDGAVTASVANLNNTTAIPSTITDLGISDGSNGMVLSTDGSGNFSFVALPAGTTDTNYYVTGGSFSGTTLTLQRSGLSSVSISGFPQSITDNSQIGNGAGYITAASVPTQSTTTGDVGTYAFLMRSTSTAVSAANPGSTYASSLYYTDRSASAVAGNVTSGTWRCMGYAAHLDRGTVWLRIA